MLPFMVHRIRDIQKTDINVLLDDHQDLLEGAKEMVFLRHLCLATFAAIQFLNTSYSLKHSHILHIVDVYEGDVRTVCTFQPKDHNLSTDWIAEAILVEAHDAGLLIRLGNAFIVLTENDTEEGIIIWPPEEETH